MIELIDPLYTPLGIASNYSATFNLHNSQITKAPDKHFPVCYAFTSPFLATASSSGNFSASALGSLPAGHLLETQLT
jgi:hypothetical protein